MTKMDLKLYEFIQKLHRRKESFEKTRNKSNDKIVSAMFDGKVKAYDEIINMIEKEFIDGVIE